MNGWTCRSESGRRILSVLAVIAVVSITVLAEGVMPTHLDKIKNPSGCAGCHKGHGKKGTMMLSVDKKDTCFVCHGPGGSGKAVGAKTDLQSVFNKRYRHPVMETSAYHVSGEELPENNPATPRHVACQDCHKVHETEAGLPLKGSRGHKIGSVKREVATEEYEVCYLCHSESANLPARSGNVAEEFDVSNSSYHPVEARGRSSRVPSLTQPYDAASRITCSDCHGNNDAFGPKGPHGSDYEFMLKKQYIMNETAEGPATYDLCYSCHNRQSILQNESFQKHNEHIVYFHAPCSSCHTPHGSRSNPNLIELNTSFAAPSPMPSYVPSNSGRPLCFLTCHIGGKDVAHDNAFYTAKKWP